MHGVPKTSSKETPCNGCALIENLSKLNQSRMKIYSKGRVLLEVGFYHGYDNENDIFKVISQVFKPKLGLEDEVKLSPRKGKTILTFKNDHLENVAVDISVLSYLILSRITTLIEFSKPSVEPLEEVVMEKDLIIEFSNSNLAYRVSLTVVKDKLNHQLRISSNKLKKKPELLQMSQVLDQHRVKILSNFVVPERRVWEEKVLQQKAENLPGCTVSCCCIAHCSIVHLPSYLGLEEDPS